jgi:hypothetical protein
LLLLAQKKVTKEEGLNTHLARCRGNNRAAEQARSAAEQQQ